MSDIIKSLNPAQREAVVNYDCPSLIVTGAGSGKTRVLTSRIAYMLENGVQPHRVLALTFTNKAAREMRERIGTMVSREQSDRLWMGTFHSIFLRILRYEADKLGYTSSFTIYDTADSRNLIKNIIKEMKLPDDIYKPNAVQARISLAKNNLVTAEAYEANTGYMAEDRQCKMPEFVEIYRAYARRCRENGAMDFDDMLLNINILFRDFPDVLAKYQQRFAYILVDEYQDTNYAQYIIIRRLAQVHSRVCVVGDDSQSIYSFRGAKIENILRFRNDYPQARTFKLEQNYRSTKTIVEAANSVIAKNENRIEKELFSAGETGNPIKVMKAYTDQEEALQVAQRIADMMRENDASWREFALLYRTNMQSRVFEEAFRRRGIPYWIYGGMSFYQRKEIKDMLAYFHLIVNPKDDEAFRRVVNFPARGIGNVTVSRLMESAATSGKSALEYIREGDMNATELNAGAIKKLRDFSELIASFGEGAVNNGLYETGLEVATKSGVIGSFKAEGTPEAQSALDNIEELLNSMQLFSEENSLAVPSDDGEELTAEVPKLTEWLQSVTLLTDMDEGEEGGKDHVTLMTVHSAKGLEYRYVFVVGLEENLFPSMMSMNGPEGIEEERRLFYVALMRAREAAVLSFSETRFKWGSMEFCRPSRFLSEIEPKYLDIAFDLDDNTPAARQREAMTDNYQCNNKKIYGGETDGYDHGRTVRGEAATKYRVAGTQSRTGQALGTEPVVPPGRFRRIATEPVGSAAGNDAPAGVVPADGRYQTGQRVAHSKFGQGVITEVEQMAADLKITVEFDNHGRKTLLSKFAKLAVIE